MSHAPWTPPSTPPPPQAPPPPPPTGAPEPPPSPNPTPSSFTFGSEVFLRTAGLGLLVLAVLFVVSTAFTRGWIGPEIQLLGAAGVGGGLLWLGDWLRPRERSWGIALSAGGVLALLATAASTLFGDLFGADLAYLALATVTAVGFAVAWRSSGSAIVSAALLGGAVAWPLVDGPIPVAWTLAWLALTVGGAVGLSELRGWASLRPLAVLTAGAGLPVLAALAGSERDRLLVGVVAGLVATVGLVGPRRSLGSPSWLLFERQVVALVGPWALGVGALLVEPSPLGLGVAAFAIGALLATVVFTTEGLFDLDHRNSMLLTAGLCGVVGLDQLLEGPALLFGVALEAAGLLWTRRTLRGTNGEGDPRLLIGALVLAVPNAIVLASSTATAWEIDAPWGTDVLHLLTGAALGVAAWLLGRDLAPVTRPAIPLFALLWLGSVLVHLPQGQMLVSLSWAVVGIALLVGGAMARQRLVLGGGVAVIVVTVGKLLTIDLAEVDTLWRAALFFVIGAGMLRTGYALPGLVQRAKVSGDDTVTEPTRSADEWPTRIS